VLDVLATGSPHNKNNSEEALARRAPTSFCERTADGAEVREFSNRAHHTRKEDFVDAVEAPVSGPSVGSHMADGGYSLAQTAPALASFSSPDSGLYHRNARARQSGSWQMLNAVL
jgi:hypothetical protein